MSCAEEYVSCAHFKFWEINGNISKTVEDRHIVAIVKLTEIMLNLTTAHRFYPFFHSNTQ